MRSKNSQENVSRNILNLSDPLIVDLFLICLRVSVEHVRVVAQMLCCAPQIVAFFDDILRPPVARDEQTAPFGKVRSRTSQSGLYNSLNTSNELMKPIFR